MSVLSPDMNLYRMDDGALGIIQPVTIWDAVWHPPVKTREGDYFVNEARKVKRKRGEDAIAQWELVNPTTTQLILEEFDRRVAKITGSKPKVLVLDDLAKEPEPEHYGNF
jgi:hypothetical protein